MCLSNICHEVGKYSNVFEWVLLSINCFFHCIDVGQPLQSMFFNNKLRFTAPCVCKAMRHKVKGINMFGNTNHYIDSSNRIIIMCCLQFKKC